MRNKLWIGANILFNLATGETTQVLQFVFREDDASTFTEENATTTRAFIESRAARYAKILWSVERSSTRPGFFVIKGVQRFEE
jgi:hypothetical protein